MQMPSLATLPYLQQQDRWPRSGRHILAHFDDDSVVVYQAYRPAIGHFAAEHQYFGGPFSLQRMSWIKPNFLWMMYRSGWASKPGQEVVLAVRMRRDAFDGVLAGAVSSSYVPELYDNRAEWQKAVKRSDVRLQWDPDHTPTGGKRSRRAIQLGLRRAALGSYAREWLIDIEDISAFVREQYEHVKAGDLQALVTPVEEVYPVRDPQVAARLGLEQLSPDGAAASS